MILHEHRNEHQPKNKNRRKIETTTHEQLKSFSQNHEIIPLHTRQHDSLSNENGLWNHERKMKK